VSEFWKKEGKKKYLITEVTSCFFLFHIFFLCIVLYHGTFSYHLRSFHGGSCQLNLKRGTFFEENSLPKKPEKSIILLHFCFYFIFNYLCEYHTHRTLHSVYRTYMSVITNSVFYLFIFNMDIYHVTN
jgi:hypothetical protein